MFSAPPRNLACRPFEPLEDADRPIDGQAVGNAVNPESVSPASYARPLQITRSARFSGWMPRFRCRAYRRISRVARPSICHRR